MKVLITGSSGFFGTTIERGFGSHSVFTLNRSKGDFHCDLSQSVPNFTIGFDIVIHNAGKAHSFLRSETEKNSFYQVNVQGTKNLIQGLEKLIPKQLVFISSVSVYGLECGENIDEDTLLNANDSYGRSKLLAEQIVEDWCIKNNVLCTILRLPLLVGKNPPGNLGTMLKGIKNGFFFNIGNGNARKSMVLAEDVAQFIPIIAQVGGVYNLTDGVHPSFFDLSNALAKKKVRVMPLFAAKFAGFIGDYLGEKAIINSRKIRIMISSLTFNDSKAREFGWKPRPVLEFLETNEL